VASGGGRIAWKKQEHRRPGGAGEDPQEARLRSEVPARPQRGAALPEGDQAGSLQVAADGEAIDGALEQVPRDVQADRRRQATGAQAGGRQQQPGGEDPQHAEGARVGVGEVEEREDGRRHQDPGGRPQAVAQVAEQNPPRDHLLVDPHAEILDQRMRQAQPHGAPGVRHQEARHRDPAQRQLDGEDPGQERRPQEEASRQPAPSPSIHPHAVGVPAPPLEPAQSQGHAADHRHRDQRAHDHVDRRVAGLAGEGGEEDAAPVQPRQRLGHGQDGDGGRRHGERNLSQQAPEGAQPALLAVPEYVHTRTLREDGLEADRFPASQLRPQRRGLLPVLEGGLVPLHDPGGRVELPHLGQRRRQRAHQTRRQPGA